MELLIVFAIAFVVATLTPPKQVPPTPTRPNPPPLSPTFTRLPLPATYPTAARYSHCAPNHVPVPAVFVTSTTVPPSLANAAAPWQLPHSFEPLCAEALEQVRRFPSKAGTAAPQLLDSQTRSGRWCGPAQPPILPPAVPPPSP